MQIRPMKAMEEQTGKRGPHSTADSQGPEQ
ncbi:hypothetical protein MEBOL_007664 [Melittangium boletus DSM 14713]|uniref:Uncharacterized protein n=1 Tax=Melittangium boletus DSM 14713 TaxID=1294270 RepID=A0A250ISC8_9BACT|nr:hypothetical protein MEBOL_007664 [Melittangium boletus DSM 14713]